MKWSERSRAKLTILANLWSEDDWGKVMKALDDVAEWLGFNGKDQYLDALGKEGKDVFRRAIL